MHTRSPHILITIYYKHSHDSFHKTNKNIKKDTHTHTRANEVDVTIKHLYINHINNLTSWLVT